MLRASLLLTGLTLLLPAAASAAPFAELPFRTVDGPTGCLTATGTPGELARTTPAGIEFLTVTADGLQPGERVPLAPQYQCPLVVTDASGAGVVIARVDRKVIAAFRDPGGAWSAPALIRGSELSEGLSAAVSPRGDAVVAWVRDDYTRARGRAFAVHRAAGGGPQAPRAVTAWEHGISRGDTAAAIGPTGEALIAITLYDQRADKSRIRIASGHSALAAAVGGVARRATPALALAADGRALLVVAGEGGVTTFERPPAGSFARGQTFSATAERVAVTLREGGAAAVAWRDLYSEAGVAVRTGAGRFRQTASVPIAEPDYYLDRLFAIGPPDDLPGPIRLSLLDDGRAFVAWDEARNGVATATVSASGVYEHERLHSPLRDAQGVTPLVLPGGRRAIAWTDSGGDRVHLALDGAVKGPVAAPPELTVERKPTRFHFGRALVLPVRCGGPCDVRASLRNVYGSERSLSRTGPGTLEFRFGGEFPGTAPRRVHVDLRWGAPGSSTAARRTVTLRFRRQ